MDTRMTSKGLPSPDHPGRLASRLAIRENTGGQPRKDAGNSTGGTDGSGGDGGRVAAAVAGTGHANTRDPGWKRITDGRAAKDITADLAFMEEVAAIEAELEADALEANGSPPRRAAKRKRAGTPLPVAPPPLVQPGNTPNMTTPSAPARSVAATTVAAPALNVAAATADHIITSHRNTFEGPVDAAAGNARHKPCPKVRHCQRPCTRKK